MTLKTKSNLWPTLVHFFLLDLPVILELYVWFYQHKFWALSTALSHLSVSIAATQFVLYTIIRKLA